MDDDFWQQIDEAEKKALSTRTSAVARAVSTRSQSSRSVPTPHEIVELESSEEEKENIAHRRPRVPAAQVETIELSD